jgi:hypothetical protein
VLLKLDRNAAELGLKHSVTPLRDSFAEPNAVSIPCQDFPDTRSGNATDRSGWSKDIYGPDLKFNGADTPTSEKSLTASKLCATADLG